MDLSDVRLMFALRFGGLLLMFAFRISGALLMLAVHLGETFFVADSLLDAERNHPDHSE